MRSLSEHELILMQAVSVSLPTWQSNVAYEEGEKWVVEKMQCGYPRYDELNFTLISTY